MLYCRAMSYAMFIKSTEVWPATAHLGNGSLLNLLQAMSMVLQRCTTGLVSLEAPSAASATTPSTSTADALRYSECVGECMRVLSAVLKSRRKASIPPISLLHETFASTANEDDAWGVTSSNIIQYGCQLLSCESCNKVSEHIFTVSPVHRILDTAVHFCGNVDHILVLYYRIF